MSKLGTAIRAHIDLGPDLANIEMCSRTRKRTYGVWMRGTLRGFHKSSFLSLDPGKERSVSGLWPALLNRRAHRLEEIPAGRI